MARISLEPAVAQLSDSARRAWEEDREQGSLGGFLQSSAPVAYDVMKLVIHTVLTSVPIYIF